MEYILNCYSSSKEGIFNEYKEYVDDADNIFADILSFIGPKNLKIAIIGCTRVGKSTLINIAKTKSKDIYLKYNITLEFVELDSITNVGKIDNLDFMIMMFDSNRTYFFGMESYRKLQIKNGNIPGIFIKNKVDSGTKNNNIVNPLDYSYHISLRHGFGFNNIIDQIVQNY